MRLDRRTLLAAGAALPFLPTNFARAQSAASPMIGDSQQAFDAWFGQGAPEGAYITYPPLSAGRAIYSVEFNDEGVSQSILGDFHHIGGGITYDEAEAGQSPYLPADSVERAHFQTPIQLGGGLFHVRIWQSTSLTSAIGGTGLIAVTDRVIRPGGGMADPFLFGETLVTLARPEVHSVVPNGRKPGPQNNEDEWVNAYPNSSGMAQMGLAVTDHESGVEFSVNSFSSVQQESMISLYFGVNPPSTLEAAGILSNHLPESQLLGTFWHIPGSNYNEGIRLHVFQARSNGRLFLSFQQISGGEESGVVTRAYLVPVAV